MNSLDNVICSHLGHVQSSTCNRSMINLKVLTIANSFLLNIADPKISLLINMKMPTSVGIFIFAAKISWSAELSMKKVLKPWGQFKKTGCFG